jgi:hypothetical protein
LRRPSALSRISFLAVVALVWVSSTVRAAAAPITLAYRVEIAQRVDRLDFSTEFLSLVFPLTMTFDDQVTFAGTGAASGTDFVLTRFGQPLFSAVPLPGPGPLLTPSSPGESFDQGESSPSSGTSWRWGASQSEVAGSGQTFLELSGSVTWPSPSALVQPDLASYLQGMTTMPLDVHYVTQFTDEYGHLVSGSAEYIGTASFVPDSPAVPEPATVLLLGAGLAAFAARRRLA